MELVNPAAYNVGRALGRLERVRTVYVVAPLCLLSWGVTLGFALHAKHNGWLYYNGGDGTYYWTMPWAIAHHLLPATTISYGLLVFLWPLALIFGSIALPALPVIVIVQVAILGPIAVLCMYAIGTRIGGRLFGIFTGFAWAVAPFAAYHFFYQRVHSDFESIALPSILGLNNLADYPSMVLTIVIAWLVLRALDERRWNDVVIAGTLCGFLIAVKPSNGFFVPAPVFAFLVARCWRETGGFLLAMVPGLITLTIWKQAGLGTIPLFGSEVIHAAAGASIGGTVHESLTRYIPFSWHDFNQNLAEIREYGWSLRLAEYLPIAGFVGALRRGLPQAVLLGFWCVDYLVFKGGTSLASVYDWSWFRYTMPGFPPYVLLTCCIVFLIPGLGRRWHPRVTKPTRLRLTGWLVATVAILVVYPFLVVVTHGGPADNRVALNSANNLGVIAGDLHVTVAQTPKGPSLRWRQPNTNGTKVGFVILRADGQGCRTVARECSLDMTTIRLVHSLSFPVWQTGPGYYRVALVAGPRITPEDGDMLLLSPAIRVR